VLFGLTVLVILVVAASQDLVVSSQDLVVSSQTSSGFLTASGVYVSPNDDIVYFGTQAYLIIDATRMINDSTPTDLDNGLHPQRTGTIDTQTSAVDGYHKQTDVEAGAVGTHFDSPDHVCPSTYFICPLPGPYRTIDQIKPQEFVGPLRIIDVRPQVSVNVNYQIQVSDVQSSINRCGPVKKGTWFIQQSGWSQYGYNEYLYKGNTGSGNNFPGWGGDAIQYLVNYTQYSGVGVDTLSIDAGSNFYYTAHKLNMGNDKVAVESVDLRDPRIPLCGAMVSITPKKRQGAPEQPARVLVYVPIYSQQNQNQQRDAVVYSGADRIVGVYCLIVIAVFALLF